MSVNLHQLVRAPRHRRRRLGRGISAGQGKTAGRGTKGQKSRTGYKLLGRFEGGQIPLVERLPKYKGQPRRTIKPVTVRIDRILSRVKGTRLSSKILLESGLISAAEARIGTVKIVGTATQLPAFQWTGKIKFTKKLAELLKNTKTK